MENDLQEYFYKSDIYTNAQLYDYLSLFTYQCVKYDSWGFFKNIFGPENLGRPRYKEIKQILLGDVQPVRNKFLQ